MQHLRNGSVPGSEMYVAPGVGFIEIVTALASTGAEIYGSYQQIKLRKKIASDRKKEAARERALEQQRLLQEQKLAEIKYAAVAARKPLQSPVMRCPTATGGQVLQKTALGQYIVADIAPSPATKGYEHAFPRGTFSAAFNPGLGIAVPVGSPT